MAANKNAQIAESVLAAVGGKENIVSVTHCMTRLRFNLKDMSVPKDEEVKAIKGTMGVTRSGGQYQVIVGTNVDKVCQEPCTMAGLEQAATIIGTAIGVVLGLIAGFYGGIIDSLIMRCCDVLFAFPDILLAIAVVAIIGQGMVNVMIAVAVFTVPSFARIIRSATISVKQAPYVEVARSLGCSNTRILFVHIFPGTIQSMIVNFTMRVGTAILAASSLSFLGFGANVTEPDWGSMLSTGRNYLNTAPHMVLFPGILIFLTVLAFNLLGDGLRDTLDPKMN